MDEPTDLKQDLATEQELRDALGALQTPHGLSMEEAQSYLPTFVAGIKKLYDLRARSIVSASLSTAEGERQLETAAQQLIIKAIGRRPVVLAQQDEPGKQLVPRPANPDLVWEPSSNVTYVEDEVGHRTAAPKEVQARFAPRCYWEEFIPSPVRFLIRSRDYELVHQALTQALFRQSVYWSHQLACRFIETISAAAAPETNQQGQGASLDGVKSQDITGQGGDRRVRRPGPQPKPEITAAVRKIIEQIVPSGVRLITKLEEIAERMDEATDPIIPCPKAWKKRQPPLRSWSDAAAIASELAVKAIKARLNPRTNNRAN